MKIAHIAPSRHLEELFQIHQDECDGTTADEPDATCCNVDYWQYHLILTQMVLAESEAGQIYRDFYMQKRVGHVILDNDAHELKGRPQQLKIDLLRRAAEIIEPTEIVLPDEYGDTAAGTIEKALDGINALSDAPFEEGFMAVPRGKNIDEYIECAKTLAKMPNVVSLGVYYGLEAEWGVTRELVVRQMRQVPQLLLMPLHLLGEGPELLALRSQYLRHEARGIDTAKLVNWGIEGMHATPGRPLPKHHGRRGGPYGYFDLTMSTSQVSTALSNMCAWGG